MRSTRSPFESLSGHIPRSWLRSSDLLPFYHQYPAACCGDFLLPRARCWVRLNKRRKSPIGLPITHYLTGDFASFRFPDFSPPRRPHFWEWPRQIEPIRSEEHTSELQSPCNLVCRLLLEKKTTRAQRGQSAAPRHAFHSELTSCLVL